jgi:hypothetical protein
MHHLGIGRKHAHTRVLALADNTTITVIALHTGEVLSTHTINPARSYWTKNTKGPRPETGDPLKCDLCRDSGETYVATHDIPLRRRFERTAFGTPSVLPSEGDSRPDLLRFIAESDVTACLFADESSVLHVPQGMRTFHLSSLRLRYHPGSVFQGCQSGIVTHHQRT